MVRIPLKLLRSSFALRLLHVGILTEMQNILQSLSKHPANYFETCIGTMTAPRSVFLNRKRSVSAMGLKPGSLGR
jgi:hypothetical protein